MNFIKPYLIVAEKDFVMVRLSGFCENNSLKLFLEEIKPMIEEMVSHLVVNCETLQDITPDWIRSLLRIQSTIKKENKSIRLILVNNKLMQLFKKEGVDTAFKFSNTLKEALVDIGLVKEKMLDTNFVNPFLTATLHVLEVQASVKAVAGKIYLKKSTDLCVGDVSGIIGIVSDSFNGSVVISFPEETFLKVMSGMLGEEYKELSKDLLDGAGEITNMIFGQAKIVLNDQGYGIKTALPSVVSGKNHSLTAVTKGPVVVVPFSSTAGDFAVEICLSA